MPRDRVAFWTMGSFSGASAWKKKTHPLPAAISCHRQLGVGFGSSIPNPRCNVDWLDLAQVLCMLSQALWVPSPVVSGKTACLWSFPPMRLTIFPHPLLKWFLSFRRKGPIQTSRQSIPQPFILYILTRRCCLLNQFFSLSRQPSPKRHQLPIDCIPMFADSLRIYDKENKTLDALFISYWRPIKSLPYISCLWHYHPSHFTTLFCFRKYNWS